MGIEPPDRGDDNIPRIDSQPRMGVPDESREEGARRAAALNREEPLRVACRACKGPRTWVTVYTRGPGVVRCVDCGLERFAFPRR